MNKKLFGFGRNLMITMLSGSFLSVGQSKEQLMIKPRDRNKKLNQQRALRL